MKKLILFTALLIIGCTTSESFNVSSSFISNSERNSACMDLDRFKIFQVIENNYALASVCEDDGKYCLGMTVLLTPQKGVDYYDDMYVRLPKDKCATQDGVYKYETKNGNIKTVPRLRWDYEYEATTDEEEERRFYESVDELNAYCKEEMSNNKKTNNAANFKQCDCATNVFAEELMEIKRNGNKEDYENQNFENNLKKKIEKKCGKVPNIF